MSILLDSCPQNPRDAAIYLSGVKAALKYAAAHGLVRAGYEQGLVERVYLRLKQRLIQQSQEATSDPRS